VLRAKLTPVARRKDDDENEDKEDEAVWKTAFNRYER
jgi:hypothetical protein